MIIQFSKHIFYHNNFILKTLGNIRFLSNVIKSHSNVGTLGHVDHGKTTLTSAITKVLSEFGNTKYAEFNKIDKGVEEQRRGITINASHIEYETSKRHYAHTDCPGHIDYIKNMITGASQMDGAILVIAADDGSMPQTKEHLLLAQQLGIKHIVVYVNKCDLVDKETIDLVCEEIRELVTFYGIDGNSLPIVVGSALSALKGTNEEIGKNSILKLMDIVDNYIPNVLRDEDSPFLMPVESAISIKDRGTVIIGTIRKGKLIKSDLLSLAGFDKNIKTQAAELRIFEKTLNQLKAGDNCGILVKNVHVDDVCRGMVLAARGTVTLGLFVEAHMYLLTKSEGGRSKPLKNKYIQIMFCNLWDIAACIFLPEDIEMVMPGDHFTAKILLRKHMFANVGDRFTIREQEATVITGVITKNLYEEESSVPTIYGFNAMKPSICKIESAKRPRKK